MTTTTALPPEAEAYLAKVREALADLPGDEREDLLAEVRDSLSEAGEAGGSILARLGPPEAFAAELREAAGLHPTEQLAGQARARTAWSELIDKLELWAARPRVAAARRLLAELAPIWWLVRGYLTVGLLAFVLDGQWSTALPLVPRLGDSGEFGLAAIVAAAAVSVALGLSRRRRRTLFPRLALAANLVLVVAAVPVLGEVADAADHGELIAAAYAPRAGAGELSYGGVRVDNVYPYSRDGRLLLDVLLYDGAGRALEIGSQAEDPYRRLLRSSVGKPVFNSFPVRYFEPKTRRVADPEAAPPVDLPRIVTPPLDRSP